MSSTRKSRTANKKYSKLNEESPDKDAGNAKKNKLRKRKLSDMLGPQWSKEELERFYEAYRKYGKDWKKVANVIRNRSTEMVEALYNMNRAYLSLPEGTASVVGLIAMITDHYNILEGSDSDRESNDGLGISRKPQKRARGKFRDISKGSERLLPDLLQGQLSTYGCLSLLKKKRCGGSGPRAVGKRTPRFPVSFPYGKDGRTKLISQNKRDFDLVVDPDDEEVAHVVALALAEASQRGGSPQVSRTPSKGAGNVRQSPVPNGERKDTESGMDGSKFIGNAMGEDYLDGSLESKEAETGDTSRITNYRALLDTEIAGTVQIPQKVKTFHGKKPKNHGSENNQSDDVREACSGTEERLSFRSVKGEVETEVVGGRSAKPSPQGSKKRSRQLFFGDESSALDALQTLADLSLNILLPSSKVESESSVQVKAEKRNADTVDKPTMLGSSANIQRDKPRISVNKEKGHTSLLGADTRSLNNAKLRKDPSLDASVSSETKQRLYPSTNAIRRAKRKSLSGKIQQSEAHRDSHPCESQKTEVLHGEGRRLINKAKQASQVVALPRHGKSAKPPEQSSSTDLGRSDTDLVESAVQVPTLNQGSLPTKLRSRRKMDLRKALVWKELKPFEYIGNDRGLVNGKAAKNSYSVHDRIVNLKDKISHCLSSQLLRRWCTFEWFYGAIDYPWFARCEFVEYLNHVGLGHVPRLARVEWNVIRSSLGKPRRLSEQFLREEREKLEQYRESVRTHYTELRSGMRDGLATDLARPLSVGQQVIACHPKTREIHDGSILTVDFNRCRVQFDRPELGVEFVMDIDCMPLNPLENMPEVLRRQNIGLDNLREDPNEAKFDIKPKEWKIGGYAKFASGENPDNAMDGSSLVAPSNYPINTLLKQAKGDTLDAIMQAKAAANQVAVAAQQAMFTQPCTFAQIQAREDDIKALAGVTRALDKKEALLVELRHMNEEVSGSPKDGDSIRDSEHFRKQYALVLLQLRDANDQLASALHYLRQRNAYLDNSSASWLRSTVNNGGLAGSIDHSALLIQDSGCHIAEIVESSRKKARTMVDAAVQAMSSLKEGENVLAGVGMALELANIRHSGLDPSITAVRSFLAMDPGLGSSPYQDHATSGTSEPTATVHDHSPKQNSSSTGNEVQIPSELISSCVATLFMIQACTERQYPPAEMAQILDTAVTSLQPCCSQNLTIYREIQQFMGIVKNQILALIPTQHGTLPTELSAV